MAKGPQFERDVCRQISLWWSNSQRDDIFWRTPGSGARATARAKQGKTTFGQVGDIMSTDPAGQLLTSLITFELKRGYNSENVNNIIDRVRSQRKASQLEQWLLKLSSANVSPYWALIHKRDRRDPVVYFPTSLFDLLVGESLAGPALVDTDKLQFSFRYEVTTPTVLRVTAVNLSDFLRYVSPLHIEGLMPDE